MKKQIDTQFWNQHRGKIRSKKGGWRIGQGVFNHGYSMMDDLVGKVSYMQVVVLNATGRLPERRMADWIEAAYICLSWPDPRIWCNQIGALAGTLRASAVAATCAGTLAQDSRAYGAYTLVPGMEFIKGALSEYKLGKSSKEIVENEMKKYGGKPKIVGYARPIAKGDERVPAMERVSNSLGYSIGEHLALAYDIEKELDERFSESMNINGYMSAFLSDQDYSPVEIYRIFSTFVASGVTACYVDQYDDVPGAFLPMCCDDIAYEGKPTRSLPEK